MGKLPGLDKLDKKKEDLLNINDSIPKVDRAIEQYDNRAIEQYGNSATDTIENKKMTTNKKTKTIKKKAVLIDAEDVSTLNTRVSKEFKLAVQVYCLNNSITEKDLIRQATDVIIEKGVNDIIKKHYDTTDKGVDTTKRIYGIFSSEFQSKLKLIAISNNVSIDALLSQGIAHVIKWNK